MLKILLVLLISCVDIYGASEMPIAVMTVFHVTDEGIKGTYTFKNVSGIEDLTSRVETISKTSPDLEWRLYYKAGHEFAWFRSREKK